METYPEKIEESNKISSQIPIIKACSTENGQKDDDQEILFKEITSELISSWENILISSETENLTIRREDDSEILNEELNLNNQRVIKNDCDRTRAKDRHMLASFREYIESFLTYYCKKNHVKYKQGMNEVIAPFLMLKCKVKISLSQIYNLFICFMNTFLTNYFYEDEFYSLQSSLSLVSVLLKYHEPVIFNIFEFALITPEMYATSWILTVFANKCKLDVIYHLWNILIKENDQLFMHFIVIAFLQIHTRLILDNELSQIPSLLSQITITSIEDVENIVLIARGLRAKTPYSFRLITQKLEIFQQKSNRLKELFESYKPDNFYAMPIFPSEVLHIAYNSAVSCPDSTCKNFKNNFNNDEDTFPNNNNQTNHLCHYCQLKTSSPEQNISYIFLDLRLSKDSNTDIQPGFLPMTVILTQEELMERNFPESLNIRFAKEKGKYHFVLMTSLTDYFPEYEKKYYEENISENERNQMMYGIQTRVSKEINSDKVQMLIKNDKKKKNTLKLQEFDILKRSILSLVQNEYTYISYVYGGFYEIHSLSMKYNFPLLNHDGNCSICKKNKKKQQKVGFFQKFFSKSKTPEPLSLKKSHTILTPRSEPKPSTEPTLEHLSIDEIASLISDPSNTVYTCLLNEYKNICSKCEKSPQIMIFLHQRGIEVYKLERSGNDEYFSGNVEENLSFTKIEFIEIEEITSVTTRRQTKNIVTIIFTSKKYGRSSMIIDLITDIDSASFISKAKTFIEVTCSKIKNNRRASVFQMKKLAI